MGSVLYILTAFTTTVCGVLLLRRYAAAGSKLLLWSGLCFIGLTLANVLIFVDLVILPETDLYTYRLGMAGISMCLLLYGLIWESE